MEPLPYLKEISLKREKISDFSRYPFSIPAVKELDYVEFDKGVTFFVGENGSGW
jgi:predicted ATPase